MLMHSATVQCCPRYINDIAQTTAASSRRQGLRSSTSSTDTFSQFHRPIPSLKNGRFQGLVHQSGTLCQQAFGTLQTSLLSSVISRLSFLTSIGSRPSDHYFRSVCLFVCLSVCLCRVFLSRPRSDLDQTRIHVTCPGLVVSPRI